MSGSVQPHRQQPVGLRHPWDSPGKNTGVGCHFLLQCMKVKSQSEVTQSCPILRDPMDCSLPGSSIHGIFQARVLEWGAIAFSKSNNYALLYRIAIKIKLAHVPASQTLDYLSTGSWIKQESSRKTSISALLTMPKPLTVWITRNCGKF